MKTHALTAFIAAAACATASDAADRFVSDKYIQSFGVQQYLAKPELLTFDGDVLARQYDITDENATPLEACIAKIVIAERKPDARFSAYKVVGSVGFEDFPRKTFENVRMNSHVDTIVTAISINYSDNGKMIDGFIELHKEDGDVYLQFSSHVFRGKPWKLETGKSGMKYVDIAERMGRKMLTCGGS